MVKRKAIGGIEEDVFITGGLVLAGYLLVKNLLPNLLPNIGVSDADREVLDEQQSAAPADNIFSVYSPAIISWLGDNEPSGFDTSDDYLTSYYQAYKNGDLSPNDPLYPALQIYAALSRGLTGHLITGDQQGVITALDSITSKGELGVISYIFSLINGVDLWTLLRRGSPWSTMIYGLDGADLAAAVKRLNNLPD